MFRSNTGRFFSAAAVIALLFASTNASNAQTTTSDRLMIVNGNNGQVIYDDGRDDLFCVTRRVIVGYTYDGRPVYRRTMRCR